MKKIISIFLSIVMTVSLFSSFAFAADEKKAGDDAFDFYSLTIHYEEPVVVSYEYRVLKDADGNPVLNDKGKEVSGYVWAEPSDKYVIPAAAFCIKNGDEEISNQVLDYQEAVLTPKVTIVKKNYVSKFYAINSEAAGIDSNDMYLNANFGISGINNNSAIGLVSIANVYGVNRYYDDEGKVNPNYQTKDGYFLDKSKDANGNYNRIDVNEFIIDANNEWHSTDGHRVEPFITLQDGTMAWIDLNVRMIDGKVAALNDLTNQYLLEKGIIKEVPAEFANVGDEFDENVDYDGNGTKGDRNDNKVYKALVKEKNTWLTTSDVVMYTIDFLDTNGDGKKTKDDLPAYNAADRKFTEADILVQKDDKGQPKLNKDGTKTYIYGTPEVGDPLTKVAVKNVTVEIDAIGDQTGNKIIITTGDIYKNVTDALDYVKAHPEKMYTEGMLIGSCETVTTKDKAGEAEVGIPSSVKSVDVKLEDGVVLPQNAVFYLNFFTQTSQGEHEPTYVGKTLKNSLILPINRIPVDLEALPDAPVEEPEETDEGNFFTKLFGCKSVIGGGMAIISVAAACVVALRKKEEK